MRSRARMKTELFKNAYVMLGLFPSLLAYLEVNLALLNVQADYERRTLNIIKQIMLPISKASLKRLEQGRRQTRPGRF